MIEPMLAKIGDPKNMSNCFWERKFDGARIIAFVSGKDIKLQARSGSDKTDIFPELRIETKKNNTILDGEVVSQDNTFSSIQRRVNRVYDIELASQLLPVRYEVFDILEADGSSYLEESLENRKQLLEDILVNTDNTSPTKYTEDTFGLWQEAVENSWEGIIGKKKSGIYEPGKRRWLKLKLTQDEEFLAVGYTEGTGKRKEFFGALILTSLDGKYVGQVGTGFSDILLEELTRSMIKADSPSEGYPVEATWIKPFKVKVQFLEYTNDGILRFPAFKELA